MKLSSAWLLLCSVHGITTVQEIMDSFDVDLRLSPLPFPPLLLADLLDQLMNAVRGHGFPRLPGEGFSVDMHYALQVTDYAGDEQSESAFICSQVPLLSRGFTQSPLYSELEKSCRSPSIFQHAGLRAAIEQHLTVKPCYVKGAWERILRLVGKIQQGEVPNSAEVKIMEMLSTSQEYLELISLMSCPTKHRREGFIARGGFGSVCSRKAGDLWVADKIIPIKTPGMVSSLVREIRAMQAMSTDPHYVKLIDMQMSTFDNVQLTMELLSGLDGQKIREKLAGRVIPIPILGAITRNLIHGLMSLHSKEMIHTDLKTPNIFFTDKGEVKILDLGLVINLSNENERMQRHGTPGFYGPEIYDSNIPLSTASDVWTLGTTILHLFTGRFPQVIKKQDDPLHWKERSLEVLEHQLPIMVKQLTTGPLRKFLLRCFTMMPSERPSIVDLLHDPFILQAANDNNMAKWIKRALGATESDSEEGEDDFVSASDEEDGFLSADDKSKSLVTPIDSDTKSTSSEVDFQSLSE